MTRVQTDGVSLLNTLVVIALGAGLVHTMLTFEDTALSQLEAAQDSAQAGALVQAGVASVASALRQDFFDAPEVDHLKEPWAQAAQQAIDLEIGRFAVDIQDARGRIDLNALLPANLAEQRLFANLLTVLDLPQTIGDQITGIVAQNGPLSHPDDLLGFGLAASDLSRLRPHVAAFAARGSINANSASQSVLAALLGNEVVARNLISRRDTKGFLETADLAALGVVLPNPGGFTSDAFDLRIETEVGLARREIRLRMLRDPKNGAISTLSLK